MHFCQEQHLWIAGAVLKEIVAECGRSFQKHGHVHVLSARIVWHNMKSSTLSLEIGRYSERLQRTAVVARFNLADFQFFFFRFLQESEDP